MSELLQAGAEQQEHIQHLTEMILSSFVWMANVYS